MAFKDQSRSEDSRSEIDGEKVLSSTAVADSSGTGTVLDKLAEGPVDAPTRS